MIPIYINGRFAAQNLSGVQRFAVEISKALQNLYAERVQILLPPGALLYRPNVRSVGRRTGHIWEQWELPRHAKNGVLVNLGNTGPVWSGKQIVVIHDAGVFSTPEAYSRKFRLWYKAMHFLLARGAAEIVTVSQFSRQELVTNLNLAPARVHVIPEGADHMQRMTTDDDILRMKDLTPGRFVLVVGTLAAHKNLAALHELADSLAARGMVLAITGAFGAAAFQPGVVNCLPKSARYLGRVTDEALKTLYGAAACFVLPSLYEGFGLPAMEAMACGCPVVAADIPALRETCGAAAIYCNPRSPDDIAATVLALLDDPAKSASLRNLAAQHVQGMTWAKAAGALREIIG